MAEPLDIDHLRRWIGNEEVVEDYLAPSLAERFHATLSLPGEPSRDGGIAPRLIHFCLCQPAAAMEALGEDGHPARGSFLPPVPLQRRMWAASAVTFSGDLRVGQAITRRSRIMDVSVKQGRSGDLCFVTVEHAVAGDGAIAVKERQTIVYRAPASSTAPSPSAEPAAAGLTRVVVDPTPTLLFRYSALTFNGHRIHYDDPYARAVEGYPGLVVHGPLQATLLFHLAAREAVGRPPSSFSFRSVSTLFGGEMMELHMGPREAGRVALWTARPGGPVAMQAEARWE